MSTRPNLIVSTALSAATELNVDLTFVDFDYYHYIGKFHKLNKRELGYLIAIENLFTIKHPTYRTRNIRGLSVITAKVVNLVRTGKLSSSMETLMNVFEEELKVHRMRLAIDYEIAIYSREELSRTVLMLAK